jgi:hypothetical protein
MSVAVSSISISRTRAFCGAEIFAGGDAAFAQAAARGDAAGGAAALDDDDPGFCGAPVGCQAARSDIAYRQDSDGRNGID